MKNILDKEILAVISAVNKTVCIKELFLPSRKQFLTFLNVSHSIF